MLAYVLLLNLTLSAGALAQSPIDTGATFPLNVTAAKDFDSRMTKFEFLKKRQLQNLAAEIHLKIDARIALESEFYFHRSDLFDRRSYGILSSGVGDIWVSATDMYAHGANIGDRFKVRNTKLFESKLTILQEPAVKIASLLELASQRLTNLIESLQCQKDFQVVTASKKLLESRSIPVSPRFPVDVAVSSQALELATGELCRVSVWVSKTDNYFDVICLKQDGSPSRAAQHGGWSKAL